MKRIACAALLLALISAAAPFGVAAPAANYADFRDIPGVTAEEVRDIETLAARYGDGGFSYGTFPST
jgi:hypothetical protein